ncbi:MAG: DUF3558 domain-containing protein [Mycolicibacterium sp.]|nr:DUF3558 domain-containing protein [Mycolicibacterium sp.]
MVNLWLQALNGGSVSVKSRRAALAAVVCAAAATACGAQSSSPNADSSTSGPVVIDPARSDGTSFEPCTAFPVEDFESWGLLPRLRQVAGAPNQPARGCQWMSSPCAIEGNSATDCWSMSALVSNRTIDEMIEDRGDRAQEVGGRPGAVSEDEEGTCYVAVPVERAVLSVGVTAVDPKVNTCDRALKIATDMTRVLPDPS